MDSTRFVSIRLFEPARVQVVNLGQVVSVDVRTQARRATANLADGSQVRGTLQQMWSLLEVVGFKMAESSAASATSGAESAETKASAASLDFEGTTAAGSAEEAAQCPAEFAAIIDHYAVQIEDEEIMHAAREMAEEEAATAILREQWERGLQRNT